MFNNYTQALAGLFRVKEVPRQYSQILMSVLARCDGDLDFRGNLTVNELTVRNGLPGASANYAVATATWVRASGHGSYVTCRAASDPIGTLTTDATTFQVFLPRSSQDKDPNVYAGDILQYVESGGVKYAVGESYLAEKIGSLKPMTINSAIKGWTKCDGSGSTANFTGKFVRGAASYGGTGGSDTHGHGGTVDDTSLDVTGTIDSATTGITIPDHPDHKHGPRDTVVNIAEGFDREIWGAIECSTGMKEAGSCSAPEVYQHPVTDSGHTHTVTSMTIDPNPHDHGLTINDGNNVPAYIEVVWYVRTGPSGEIT